MYGKFIRVNEAILIYYYYLKSILYSGFHPGSCIIFNQHVTLYFPQIKVFQLFFGFVDIDSLSTFQVIWGMPFSWDFSEVFLMRRMKLWYLRRNITEVKCHSHHIISKVYPKDINMILLVDVNLYHLANVMFVRFLR